MRIQPTAIKDVLLLEPRVFGDERGFFMETYRKAILRDFGVQGEFVQDNHSLSVEAGTLRGLHFQKNPKAQTKLVRVVRGAILDVAVDIRQGSPTYGAHVAEVLSADNHRQLLIPRGFAHGFVTLAANTEVVYKVDEYYSHAEDRGILWSDPALKISWRVDMPLLSEKDKAAPLLAAVDNDFIYTESSSQARGKEASHSEL